MIYITLKRIKRKNIGMQSKAKISKISSTISIMVNTTFEFREEVKKVGWLQKIVTGNLTSGKTFQKIIKKTTNLNRYLRREKQ